MNRGYGRGDLDLGHRVTSRNGDDARQPKCSKSADHDGVPGIDACPLLMARMMTDLYKTM